ncbi:MAG: hypothetical protein QW041_01550 [Candidatus Pacearchaeota archaeon]
MPYIKQKQRKKWERLINEINEIIKKIPERELDGELNYLFSKILIMAYPPKYFNYNRAIGLLECIKQEFYRRRVAPYEDKKIKENEDI